MVKQRFWLSVGSILIFAAAGVALVVITRAAILSVSTQASSGVLGGNAKLIADTQASNAQVVRFGASSNNKPVSFTSPPSQFTAPLLDNQYVFKFNEWNSERPVTMTSDGGANFEIKNSSLNIPTGGAPSGYWELVKGSSWGANTANNGAPFPYLASSVKPGQVTTSATCHTDGVSGDWNNSYDVWFNGSSTAGQTNNQAAPYLEMMIWLDHTDGANPIGDVVASNVTLGGNKYNIWFGGDAKSESTVSYVLSTPSKTYSTDLYPLIQDSISRGYMPGSWYMLDVEFGFEIWNGGSGLGCTAFSVDAR